MAIPRRELLDRDMYTILNTIQATRGCPFNCEYCAVTTFFGRDFRCRPVGEIVAEIKSQPGKLSNRPEEYAAGIRQLQRCGITIMGSFIFGLDGDDLGVFRRTVDFVNSTKIDSVLYHILTPFPGTRLYDEMERQGRIHDRDWSHYDTGHSVIHPKGMTSEELQNGWYWAIRETYKLPNILRRIVRPGKGWKGRLAANYSQFRKVHRYPRPLHPEKYGAPPSK